MTNCFFCSVWIGSKNNGLGGGAIFIGKTSFWISRGGETEIGSMGIAFKNTEKICYQPCTEDLETIWIKFFLTQYILIFFIEIIVFFL